MTSSATHMLVNFNSQWILPRLLGPEQFLDISTAGCEREAGEETGVAQNIQVGVGLGDCTKLITSFRAVGIELVQANGLGEKKSILDKLRDKVSEDVHYNICGSLKERELPLTNSCMISRADMGNKERK